MKEQPEPQASQDRKSFDAWWAIFKWPALPHAEDIAFQTWSHRQEELDKLEEQLKASEKRCKKYLENYEANFSDLINAREQLQQSQVECEKCYKVLRHCKKFLQYVFKNWDYPIGSWDETNQMIGKILPENQKCKECGQTYPSPTPTVEGSREEGK